MKIVVEIDYMKIVVEMDQISCWTFSFDFSSLKEPPSSPNLLLSPHFMFTLNLETQSTTSPSHLSEACYSKDWPLYSPSLPTSLSALLLLQESAPFDLEL